MTTISTTGGTDVDGTNRAQNPALGFVVAFLASLLAAIALPIFAGTESVLSEGGVEKFGPFAVPAASVLGFMAVILSRQGWMGMSPQSWPPVAVIGAIADHEATRGFAVEGERSDMTMPRSSLPGPA